MGKKSDDDLTPFGKILAVVGFFAGFSAVWQNSEEFVPSFIGGIIVAVIGGFVGNIVWRLFILALAIVIAVGSFYLRHEVWNAARDGISDNAQTYRENTYNPQPTVTPKPIEKHTPSWSQSPNPTSLAKIFSNQGEFDIYSSNSNRSVVYIFYSKNVWYELDRFVYFPSRRALIAKTTQGSWVQLGEHVNSTLHPRFLQAGAVIFARTAISAASGERETIESQTVSLFHAGTKSVGILMKDAGSFEYEGKTYNHGITIEKAFSGMPAQQAKLKPGDVVYKLNGSTVHNSRDFKSSVQNTSQGKLTISYLRGGKIFDVTVVPTDHTLIEF